MAPHGKGKPNRTYTEDERATWVAMLDAEGYPGTPGALEKVARVSGIHRSVITSWWNRVNAPPDPTLIADKKRDIAVRLEALVHQYIDLLAEKLDGANPATLQIGLGITLDKLQLLSGGPTSRHETIAVSDARTRLDALLTQHRERTAPPAAVPPLVDDSQPAQPGEYVQ